MGRHSAKKGASTAAAQTPQKEVPERLRAELTARRNKRRRVIFAILATISLLLAGVVAAGAFWIDAITDRMELLDLEGNVIDLELEDRLADEPYTILILGYDRDEWGSSRSDTIMLARIDEQKGKVWLVSIPRDIKVDLEGYGPEKINGAYSVGGPSLAVRTVEELTGISIHGYIGIELEGFVGLVDAMGGVEIDVPMYIEAGGEEWEQPIYPGPQTLGGYEALWFVRTRYQFEDSDLTRVQNQQLFLKAVADQASDTPVNRLLGVVSAVSNMVETNMNLLELGRMTRALRTIGSDNIYTATVPVIDDYPYLAVQEPDFSELMRRLMAGEPIGLDDRADSGDDTLGGEAGSASAHMTGAPRTADIRVDIRNGSDRNGLAAQASTLLQSAGFVIGEVGNVQNPGAYSKTYVVYDESLINGKLVASHLQPGIEVRASNGAYTFDGDVLIVIGSDWDLEQVPVSSH